MVSATVQLQGISWRYEGAEQMALAGVDLSIGAGEWITITGPSGCGKSTLALLLTGFIPHRFAGELEGVVRVGEVDTTQRSPQELAGVVGMAQQDPESQLCTLTVEDEVAFGPENLCLPLFEVEERLSWALQAVGASHLRHRSLHTLSGGEKQRIGIAAILAMQPQVLILDEPTANLDPRGVAEVLAVIERLRREQGTTVIVIEHRLRPLLPLTDRLIVMAKGRIVADGRPHEINYAQGVTELCGGGSMQQSARVRLSARDLHLVLGEQSVLNGVSLQLHEGEITALMGDNGSGKTSLLLSLLGILKPDRGQVCWDGQDISARSVFDRARMMGLTFQNPNHQIFEHTVQSEASLAASNLSELPPDPTNTAALLDELGLGVYANRHPLALSMGEKKRLCLASVLAYSPPLLLLDEPAIGQDARHWQKQSRMLNEQAAAGSCILMVCHEPALALACHRLLFMSKGRLLIDAPPAVAFEELQQRGFDPYLPAEVSNCAWA